MTPLTNDPNQFLMRFISLSNKHRRAPITLYNKLLSTLYHGFGTVSNVFSATLMQQCFLVHQLIPSSTPSVDVVDIGANTYATLTGLQNLNWHLMHFEIDFIRIMKY